VFIWSIARLEIDWNAAKVALTALTFVTAIVTFSAIWIAGITISFWWIDTAELVNTGTYGGNYMAQHPLTIFGRWMRRFAIFIVPIAFISYFPALAILDKVDALAYPRWMSFLGVPVAVAAGLIAWWQWGNAVRHYRSTGS
jgi:ABC-2 type transport system permease protein